MHGPPGGQGGKQVKPLSAADVALAWMWHAWHVLQAHPTRYNGWVYGMAMKYWHAGVHDQAQDWAMMVLSGIE